MVRDGDMLIQPLHIQSEACGRFSFLKIAKLNELWRVEWVWCGWQVRKPVHSSVGFAQAACSQPWRGAPQQEPSPGCPCPCPLFMCNHCLPPSFVLLLWEDLLESIKGASENWRAEAQIAMRQAEIESCPRSQRAGFRQGNRAGGPAQRVLHGGSEWFSLAP